MRSLRILCFVFAPVFSFAALCAKGQDDPNFEIGLKSYGSYHMGNIDSVNLGNGSLSVDIPLISYPQRGGKLKLDFSLHYYNGSSSKSEKCYSGNCIWIPSGNTGYFGVVDKQSLNAGPSPTCTVVNSGNGEEYCNYKITESDGAPHLYAPTNSASSTYRSIDGTGILNASIESDGITHSNMTYAYADSREDANGNEIAYSISAGTWTDTMGRSIPAPVKSTNQSDFAGCTGAQPIAYVELWTLPGVASASGGNSAGTYPLKYCYSTLPIVGWNPPTVTELTSVVLPNNTAWTFAYTQSSTTNMPVMDLSQVTFPTGGTLSYTWTSLSVCSESTSPYAEDEAVLTRTLNPNDGVTPASEWTYSYNSGVTTLTDPAGNVSTHTFGVAGPPGTANACYLYENQAKYSNSTGTLLKTVNTKYSYSLWDPVGIYLSTDEPAINVVPIEVDTIWPNGQQSTIKHTYDAGFTVYYPFYNSSGGLISGDGTITAIYGKELTKGEYDYGNGLGNLLRTTTTSYLALNNSTYLGYNLLDLPSSVQITDGGGTQRAYTTYSYDGASLVSSGITTQHVTPPNGTYRGNPTSISRWLNTTGTYLASTNTYFDTGAVNVAIDPKTNPTTYAYSPTYVGALPTTVTNALNQSVTNAYDFNSGLLTSTTDPNSKTTSYQYDDMLRTTQISYPDSGQASFSYPNPNQVNVTETNNYSPNRLSYLIVDGVGREIRQAVTNGESTPYDEADTCYDGPGRVSFKSYPFQDSGPFTTSRSCGSPELGDSFAYDGLSRKISITHSDASTVLTSYAGRATSVQDEGNGTQRVQRVSQMDGLGRLASLCEVTSITLTVGISSSTVPAACGQDIAATGFLTTYAYDALDDLTSVAQGPLNTRMFVYDSLSRLTSSANPEAGTTSYTYDADGNVITKKDARGTTICYGAWSGTTCNGAVGYDAINELLEKSYSDGTPTATYNYGQGSAMGLTLTNTIGRRSSESTAGSNSTGSVFSYDPMGRVNINSQCTPQNCSGTPFSIVYTYDLLGDVHTSTNGAAVTLTNSYNAGARLTSVTSSLSDSNHPGTPFGYQNVAHYNAAGSILSVTLGNGINETRAYDGRLRLTAITDGSVYTLTIPSGYAPNNDILAANDSVNGNWNYAYDGFNRLCASNQGGQTPLLCTSTNNTGQKAFTYADDRFGNRWNQNVTTGSGPAPSYGFDANNHIVAGSGVTYDAAGDTTDDGVTTYTFDAEGRIITANNGSSGTSTYVYDAEGRRVRKTTVAGGTVDFLYDLAGHEVSQISSTGSWTRGEFYAGGRHLATYSGGTGGTTYFTHADWLGTERARSNVAGTLCETITSLPYGDAMTTSGSCGDPSPMHFTGKEHDAETDLENFGARYDASSMGRFMTPDWSAQEEPVPYAKLDDPQSLNLYTYVGNNPLVRDDPDGHAFGLDDLIGAVAGATVGVAVEVVKDVATGQKITAGSVAGAAVGGALFGEGIVNAPETLGGSVVAAAALKGAVQGAVSNAVQQGVDMATGEQKSFNGKALAVSTVAGAVTGGIASKVPLTKIPGISSGKGNMNAVAQAVRTKIANGTVAGMSVTTAIKGAIGGQVANAGRTAAETTADIGAKTTCNATFARTCQ